MKSYVVPGTSEPGYSGIIRHGEYKDGTFNDKHSEITTLYEMFQHVANKKGAKPFVGTRTFNAVTRKFGDYEWKSGEETVQMVEEFGSGIDHVYQKHVGGEGQQALGIYSINRAEWQLAEFAGFRSNKYSVALYDTLGAESVEFIVQHARVAVIVCSIDKVPRLLQLKAKLPALQAIISMDAFAEHSNNPLALPFTVNSVRVLQEWAESQGVALYDVPQVVEMGRATPTVPRLPVPTDLCTICYTSGTTGNPKGAMSTHESYVFSAKSGILAVPIKDPVYLSFLPLAHCYERIVQYIGMLGGGQVGFYSGDVLNIADDAQALRPTIMIGVPRLFNRIYDRIAAATLYAPGLGGVIARKAISAKLENLKAGHGFTHALWDRVVCNKIRQFFGGNLELLISGSAPIDGKVLNFLRVALATTVLEGYGSTECNAAATVSVMSENTANHVGIPYPAIDIRLRDVPEMNYLSTDKPSPRGEILIRGKNVFKGYFGNDEMTKEAFDGEWLITGDIGALKSDGNLQIIDRRKNIIKLAQGEYVAVEHLETIYSSQKLLQNIFVHGDSLQSTLVAVVVPDPETFLPWARKLTNTNATLEELCASEQVVGALLVELRKLGRNAKLQGFEIIRQVYCDPVPFDIETNGLLTSTFKLKRNIARDYYRQQIDDMYSQINQK
ncbi:medium-chain fatty acid-CoA ligase faa2 [Coemansia sp. RSA 1822]|nr:medium-chain fatty acid-CoA ligase faa2 [Coemansia sp. RSA 638]KAJ2122317.1 medium-chain fatty acid-CoA ligase faa2 [Coemansia sp. RSA 720]KAJ2539348.1 medium-chain fatty acid-CoA ligase faa2 [Coemansia sp. RSA 1853]KAJ2559375.1 medium-chain fatty acid-CoA ligase faa2 [Coemansia sp. RSA 1822]